MNKKIKAILIFVAAALLFFVAHYFIEYYQVHAILKYDQSRFKANEDIVESSLLELSDEIRTLTESYESGLEIKAYDIGLLLETMDEQEAVSKAAEICETEFIFIAGKDGVITAAAQESMFGRDFDEVYEENELADDEHFYNDVTVTLEDGRRICYGERMSVFNKQIASLYDYSLSLGEVDPDGTAFTFLAYDNSGVPTILYYNHDGETIEHEPLSVIGLDGSILQDDYESGAEINGRFYILKSRYIESEMLGNVYLITGYMHLQQSSLTERMIRWTSFLLALCLVALACYGCFLLSECSSRKLFIRKLLRTSALLILIVYAVTFYTQTLEMISEAVAQADFNASLLEDRLDRTAEEDAKISSAYQADRQAAMELVAACVNENADRLLEGDAMTYRVEAEDGLRQDRKDAQGNPIVSYANCPFLQKLAELNEADTITVFNRDGFTVATSGEQWYYTLKDIEDEATAEECYAVLDGMEHFYYGVYEGYTFGTIGTDTGSVVMTEDADAINLSMASRDKLVRQAASASTGGIVEIFDTEETPLPESTNRFVRDDADRFFVHTSRFTDGRRYADISYYCSDIFAIRNYIAPADTLCCTGAFLVLILFMTLLFKPCEREEEEPQRAPLGRGTYDFKKWNELKPEEKLSFVVSTLLFLTVLVLGYVTLQARYSPQNSSAIGYILNGDWERGLNFFSLAGCGVTLFGAFALSLIVRMLSRFITNDLPEYQRARSSFVSALLSILLFVVAALVCLYYLGLNVKGLFASAGIIAGVIGVASKESIAGILNGAVNVFKDRYRVGEYVEIGDFGGIVKKINLGTVVLEDSKGNIKVVGSSELSGIVNKSRKDTRQYVSVPVSSDNDTKLIDRIIEENLDALDRKYSDVLTAPIEYHGVSGVLDNFTREINFRVSTSQKEAHNISYDLAADVTDLLKENGIRFPLTAAEMFMRQS